MASTKNGHKNASHTHDIIVIGASAGGVQAVMEIVAGLPPRLPAAIFIVIHTSPASPGILPQILNRAGPLKAAFAINGEPIEPGRIYIAPADHHVILKTGRVGVSRGPKENGFRPAVDPMFRTAARVYGPRVVGVILSGGLDDGTSGLLEVKRYGGVAVVQDPAEAVFPSMPQSAILSADVDHVVNLAQIPALLVRLASERAGKGVPTVSPDEADLPDIAESGTENLEHTDTDGPPSALTCPECGGALWEVQNGKLLRYRCHLGHGFTAESLNDHKGKSVEAALWTAMRALEEHASLRRRLASRTRNTNLEILADQYEAQARDADERAAVIRGILLKDTIRGPVEPTYPSPKARERAGNKETTSPSPPPSAPGKSANRRRTGLKNPGAARATARQGANGRNK